MCVYDIGKPCSGISGCFYCSLQSNSQKVFLCINFFNVSRAILIYILFENVEFLNAFYIKIEKAIKTKIKYKSLLRYNDCYPHL